MGGCGFCRKGAVGATIHLLGSTPGLFIFGSFAILIMWIFGSVWITRMLLIVGGYLISLQHARVLIVFATVYAIYFVNVPGGSLGVFISFNLAYVSSNLQIKMHQGYDGVSDSTNFEEQKESEPVVDDFSENCEYFSVESEAEKASPTKSSPCKTPTTPTILNIQKEAPFSKVLKVDPLSVDEMKMVIDSSNHYETFGLPRYRSIDRLMLKKEYRRMAVLVHLDKNMGNPLASDSFKKLQCAYETRSDFTKKKTYDDQLKKEESRILFHNSRGASQQNGLNFHSDESTRIECTKCGNSHIWICTIKSKATVIWCQDCSLYHPSKDGEGWVEYRCSHILSSPRKVEIPRA